MIVCAGGGGCAADGGGAAGGADDPGAATAGACALGGAGTCLVGTACLPGLVRWPTVDTTSATSEIASATMPMRIAAAPPLLASRNGRCVRRPWSTSSSAKAL
ncbi:MAG: hypothetical protein QOD02_5617 [Mycobacterium sp.]|nr:hypothetical protein [Mycobacterium sp.]